MDIVLTLDVQDSDADEDDSTGLTNEAYDRLSEALIDAGFGFVSGPSKV